MQASVKTAGGTHAWLLMHCTLTAQALQGLQELVAPEAHVVMHVMEHMNFGIESGWPPGGVDIYRWVARPTHQPDCCWLVCQRCVAQSCALCLGVLLTSRVTG